jgi:biofilm PGA synthesis N-glycosyltransferase PgaC
MKVENSYVLISPCRSECRYVRATLESILAPSVRPPKWIIVDGGSTDAIPEVLREYAAQHTWIQIITRKDRVHRALGSSVVDPLHVGCEAIEPSDFALLCKLDLDLRHQPRCFELLMERMLANAPLFSSLRKAYVMQNGRLEPERSGDDTSLDMTKFYRTTCFQAIGGFVREVVWEGIDNHPCHMRGWIACSRDGPDLRFVQLRPTGSSQESIYVCRMQHFFGLYFMGTEPLFMVASAASRDTQKPHHIGSTAILRGWVRAAIQKKPRCGKPAFRRFLRQNHMRNMLQGKGIALQSMEWSN